MKTKALLNHVIKYLSGFNILSSLLILYCLSPQIEYLIFFSGVKCIVGRSESVFSVVFILFSVISVRNTEQKKFFEIFSIIGVIFGVNVLSCLYQNPFPQSIIEAAKIGKNFYLVFPLGYLIYDRYLARGEDDRILDLIYLLASIISFVNILQVIDAKVLNLGYYNSVKTFTLSNYPSRESYLATRRTLGYFFDLHGQYYLPIISVSLLLLEKRKNIIYPIICGLNLLSVILSQIRLAYAMFPVILIYAIFSIERRKRTLYLLTTTIGIVVLSIVSPRVVIHYLNQISWGSGDAFGVILNHLIAVPINLFIISPAAFFLGGAPYLRSVIYSEVYFWTLFFYIGLIGVILLMSPIILFRDFHKYNKWLFPFVITGMSLLHYKVFNTGINIFAAAIPIAAVYKYFDKQQIILKSDS